MNTIPEHIIDTLIFPLRLAYQFNKDMTLFVRQDNKGFCAAFALDTPEFNEILSPDYNKKDDFFKVVEVFATQHTDDEELDLYRACMSQEDIKTFLLEATKNIRLTPYINNNCNSNDKRHF